MNDNPFKIIRPTDQPPEHLRKEVLGSVKFVMLLMRFLQLFMADYANALFESVRVMGEDGNRKSDRTQH
ncbi:MAG TPA: hypothetical protein VHL57_05160 [Flavobacteriales bacterium]|jgi:hypothetical protein|nr:hypothetical protein [Flavobacteriales bacterium]